MATIDMGACERNQGNIAQGFLANLAGFIGLSSLIQTPQQELAAKISKAKTALQNAYNTGNLAFATQYTRLQPITLKLISSNNKVLNENIEYHDELINEKLYSYNLFTETTGIMILLILLYILAK
jgi:hypothetical protein